MNLSRTFLASAVALSLASCADNENIGSSIVQDKVSVVIDSAFTVSGKSAANPTVQAHTDLQLLGIIDAKGYGKLSSDIVSQFMPANYIDTVGVTEESIDSLMLVFKMYRTDYVGDSIAPMAMDIYKLDRQLPSPIFSNFDPKDYYSPSNLLASRPYNAVVHGVSDSLLKTDKYQITSSVTNQVVYLNRIEVKLPHEMGLEIFRKYKESPDLFNDPKAFARWFPGFYIKNSFGSGRVMAFMSTGIDMYYKKAINSDSIINTNATIMSVSPEVINNNIINLEVSPELVTKSATTPIITGPTGYETEITLPAAELASRYKAQSGDVTVLNTITLEIPAEEIANTYNITVPTTLLLIKKSEKDKFFETSQINDNVTSFYAEYNSTRKSYIFSSMRDYLVNLLKKDKIEASDGEYILTPVTRVTETINVGYNQTETVTMAIVPYMGVPVMGQLDLKNAKIKMTFTKQDINF